MKLLSLDKVLRDIAIGKESRQGEYKFEFGKLFRDEYAIAFVDDNFITPTINTTEEEINQIRDFISKGQKGEQGENFALHFRDPKQSQQDKEPSGPDSVPSGPDLEISKEKTDKGFEDELDDLPVEDEIPLESDRELDSEDKSVEDETKMDNTRIESLLTKINDHLQLNSMITVTLNESGCSGGFSTSIPYIGAPADFKMVLNFNIPDGSTSCYSAPCTIDVCIKGDSNTEHLGSFTLDPSNKEDFNKCLSDIHNKIMSQYPNYRLKEEPWKKVWMLAYKWMNGKIVPFNSAEADVNPTLDFDNELDQEPLDQEWDDDYPVSLDDIETTTFIRRPGSAFESSAIISINKLLEGSK